ncbi:MAG: HupE/UreJ family protein [Rubrivivax sp.]|nr:HupE/UreJ family protein [Rubrivivax sp.]
MTSFIVRNLALGASLMIIASAAPAHTGHGHEDLSSFEGLIHALSQPDHLLMLLAGTVVTSLLAPRLLRLGNRLLAGLRRRLADRRGTAPAEH